MFSREGEGWGGGIGTGMSKVREIKNETKQEVESGPRGTHLGLLTRVH